MPQAVPFAERRGQVSSRPLDTSRPSTLLTLSLIAAETEAGRWTEPVMITPSPLEPIERPLRATILVASACSATQQHPRSSADTAHQHGRHSSLLTGTLGAYGGGDTDWPRIRIQNELIVLSHSPHSTSASREEILQAGRKRAHLRML